MAVPRHVSVEALEQPLHSLFFLFLHWKCSVTAKNFTCMWHSLRPTRGAVEQLFLNWLTPPCMKRHVFPSPSLSWHFWSICAYLHLSMCVFVIFLPVFASVKCKQNWMHPSSFSSFFIPLFQFSPSLYQLLTCSLEVKLLGMAWHQLVHLDPCSFLVWFLFWLFVWVGSFYLLLSFYFRLYLEIRFTLYISLIVYSSSVFISVWFSD